MGRTFAQSWMMLTGRLPSLIPVSPRVSMPLTVPHVGLPGLLEPPVLLNLLQPLICFHLPSSALQLFHRKPQGDAKKCWQVNVMDHRELAQSLLRDQRDCLPADPGLSPSMLLLLAYLPLPA